MCLVSFLGCKDIKVSGAEMYFSQQTKAAPQDYYQYHRWQDCAEECKKEFIHKTIDACSWKYEPLREYRCTHVVNVVNQMISSSATESGVACSNTANIGKLSYKLVCCSYSTFYFDPIIFLY